MTRAYCITLLTIVVLASFAGAAQNSGKVWWPKFRGPDLTGIGEGKPPVNFGPTRPSLGKLPWGLGCRRQSFGKSVFSYYAALSKQRRFHQLAFSWALEIKLLPIVGHLDGQDFSLFDLPGEYQL